MSASPPRPDAALYAGLFLITLSTLMFEILLTRIFSVTLWYHFAFMVVSLAMFGLSAGALVVHFQPRVFTAERAREQMARWSLGFGLSMLAGVLLHAALPASGAWSVLLTYLILTVPFACSGICVCIALTRFPDSVSRLYAADLLGAAAGCVGVIFLLEVLDGISAVLAISFVLSLAAAVLLHGSAGALRRWTLAALLLTGLATLLNGTLAYLQLPRLGVRWSKGLYEAALLYERWNHFSRIGVYDDAPAYPAGWGLSPTYRPRRPIRQLWLRIDGVAGTLLTEFDGDLDRVDHLGYDVSNLAHYLRTDGSILIIGAGGGRDVLSALLLGQRRVVAVELNDNILETVNGRYGELTGHLDAIPGVRFVNDEARAYVAQSDERFDLIQASWIDTWAATAAGAFVLTENTLYTVEAWTVFLDHLEPGGILTMTREYRSDDPRAAARLLALGRAALERLGVEEPERHMMLFVNVEPESAERSVAGNATILVSPDPFPAEDVRRAVQVASEMRFEVAWTPLPADGPELFRTIATGGDLDQLERSWGFRLDAPTADSPFFFNMVRIGQLLDPEVWRRSAEDANLRAVSTLLVLQVLVLLLALVCLILPLLMSGERPGPASGWLLLYFSAIGLGFMLIEVAQMQRLTVFLGHPTYGLAVVLFALLLGGGVGSWLTSALGEGRLRGGGLAVLGSLLGALIVAGRLTPRLVEAFQVHGTGVRILLAAVLMLVLGLLMGTAFPLGMRAARVGAPSLTPWFWGMNGATSVVASVGAVLLSIELGISVAYWAGAGAYVLALVAFGLGSRADR